MAFVLEGFKRLNDAATRPVASGWYSDVDMARAAQVRASVLSVQSRYGFNLFERDQHHPRYEQVAAAVAESNRHLDADGIPGAGAAPWYLSLTATSVIAGQHAEPGRGIASIPYGAPLQRFLDEHCAAPARPKPADTALTTERLTL